MIPPIRHVIRRVGERSRGRAADPAPPQVGCFDRVVDFGVVLRSGRAAPSACEKSGAVIGVWGS